MHSCRFNKFDDQSNYSLETCMDGIKNQNELFVDCGGSCPACGKASVRAYFTICHIVLLKLGRLTSMINCLNHATF